jgi:hypothetical protein
MRLSQAELEAALARLSDADAVELVGLLEYLKRHEEETRIDDPRPSIASMLVKSDTDYAGLTESSKQYLAAIAAHRTARDKHRSDLADHGDVSTWLSNHLAAFRRATAAAAEEAPMPSWLDYARKAPPEPARPQEAPLRTEAPRPVTAPPAAPPQPLKGQPYVARTDLDRFTDRSGIRWPDEEYDDR